MLWAIAMHAIMSSNRTDANRLNPAFGSVQQFGMSNGGGGDGSGGVVVTGGGRGGEAGSAGSGAALGSGAMGSMGGVSGGGVAGHVTLPPISSFDNLIRAAEKQYSETAPGRRVHMHNDLALMTSPVLLSYQLTSPHHASSVVQRRLSSASSVSSSASVSSSSISHNAQLQSAEPSLSPLQRNPPTSSSSLSSATKNSHSTSNVSSSANSSKTNSKIHKARKKKECPICHNFYANLSTHKSTHLTPEDRPHKCPICNRAFARNNDLIRHKKRHWKDEIVAHNEHKDDCHHCASEEDDETDHNTSTMTEYDQLKSLHQIKGTFKCPYNSSLIQLDMEVYPYKSKPLKFETSNCHQTGVFSRCDTFKNHLKALHFEYPPGTKKRDRAVVPGRCKHCGLKFPNVDVWLNEHVGKTCGYSYH